MTIEEVTHKAVVYARKVRDGNDENCWEYDELRAALVALVAQARDEEAEACAELCECYVRMVDGAEAIEAIRARIAGRKV